MEMSGEFSNDTLLNYWASLGNFSFGTIIHFQIDIQGEGRGGKGGGKGGEEGFHSEIFWKFANVSWKKVIPELILSCLQWRGDVK